MVFHRLPRDRDCEHCGSEAPSRFDWSFVDAAYCISLVERGDRMRDVASEFHRVGLCRTVWFYRPRRHPTDPVIGISESHQAVARRALQCGHSRILVMEDDVRFSRRLRPTLLRTVADAVAGLPNDWRIFYLGHWPITARFIQRNVLQTRSACTHAYLADRAMLEWLDGFCWHRDAVRDRWIGKGIDAAFASLPGAYAYFPMLAFQSPSVSDNRRRPGRPKRVRRPWHLLTRTRLREVLISGLMRPNEYLVAILALVRSCPEALRWTTKSNAAPGSRMAIARTSAPRQSVTRVS